MKKQFLLMLVALLLATLSSWATTTTVRLYSATASTVGGIGVSTEHFIGTGSWKNDPAASAAIDNKMELYLPLTSLGTFTINDIYNLQFSTKKVLPAGSNLDFYWSIYTNPYTNGYSSWYGQRITSEPMYYNNYDAPYNLWNTYTTDGGPNQMTFFDSNHSPAGYSGAPTLADIQAGPIAFSASSPYWTSGSGIDYGSQTVKYISIATGSAWNASMEAYLDDIRITLNNGDVLIIDLEEKDPSPIASIETPTSTTCGTLDVPVTVKDFKNIGSVSMVLNFDPVVFEYQTPTAVELNAAISEADVNTNTQGLLKLGWFSENGITLPDDATLFTLHLKLKPSKSGISKDFTWSITSGDCEFAGPGATPIYVSTFNNLTWEIPVRPVVNTTSHIEYCIIQDAIDGASSGDAITVAAGTFVETLKITKNISLMGAGKDVTIIQPASLLATGVAHKYDPDMKVAVFVNGASAVTIKDMTIDGNNLGQNAVVFWNASSGTLDNLKILNPATFTGIQTGQGLAVDATAPASVTLNITDCDFLKWNKNAIDAINGNSLSSGGGDMTIHVKGGTILGRGIQPSNAQNGILFWARAGGNVGGSIDGVAISDIQYTPDSEGCAILLLNALPLTVSNCTFSGVDQYITNYYPGYGMYSGNVDAITGNIFDGISSSSASIDQLGAIEDRMGHKMDDFAGNLIMFKSNTLVATTTNLGIPKAVEAASSTWTVDVVTGTHILSSTLYVLKPITIQGASELGAIIDLSAVSGYGFDIETNDITLKNFTVIPNPTTGTYTLKTNPVGTTPWNNLTYDHITIDGSKKTPFDIHGYNHVNLTNLTTTNTISGNGINFSGCDDVTLSGITSSGNAWGSIAISVSTYVQRGTSNLSFDFNTNSIDDFVYIEDENGYANSNINVSNWTFGVNNEYSATSDLTAYQNKTKTDALNLGAGLNTKFSNMLSYCWDPTFTTHHVGPGMSIQRSINKASNNYIIDVVAGTYSETINVDKGVTLIGANAGFSCSGRGDESTIVGSGGAAVTVAADGVTIDGFEITNPAGNFAITATGKNNLFIQNNKIHDIGTFPVQSGATHAVAIVMSSTTDIDNVTVKNNCFSYIMGGENNTLTGPDAKANNGSAAAIGVGWSNAEHDITGLLIEGNKISNVSACSGSDFANGGKGAYGVMINVGAGSANVGKAVNPVIQNNTISGLSGLWSHAIGLEGATHGAIVQKNVISDLNSTKTPSDATGVMVEDNSGSETVGIHNNSFTGLSFGIINATAGLVDATCNWYGTEDYNHVFPQILGNVNFVSYLTTSDINNPSCDGVVPPVHNVTQNLYYYSIQAAIDATTTVDNDVIEVSNGTYNESPNITKSLTLKSVVGRDVTTIILQSGGGTYLGSLQISAANVEVDGFTIVGFDATTGTACSNIMITSAAVDVKIKNNKLKVGSIGASANGDDGIGIATYYSLTTNIDVLVDNNLFEPLNATGYRAFYMNPGVDAFNFTNNTITGEFTGKAITQAKNGLVKDNTVTGTGTSAGLGTWGYPDAALFGHTSFEGNTISNVDKGIAIYNTNNVTITDNTITGNNISVWLGDGGSGTINVDFATVQINKNKISDNTTFGVSNTLTTTVDATSNWWGEATGPQNVPNNTCGLGNSVSSYVDFEPWYLDAEMTTLFYVVPTFTSVPGPVTVDQHQARDPYATGTPEVTSCSSYTLTYNDDRSGLNSCNATGTILRTWTATDYSGDIATCTQTITVVDNDAPVVVVPADITVNNDPGNCSAVVNFAPTATDFAYFQGFEDVDWVAGLAATMPSTDWNEYESPVIRVVSGTDLINSKSGFGHAIISEGSGQTGVFSRLGGYSNSFGNGFVSSVDVYIDLTDSKIDNFTYGWDVSTAVNKQDGSDGLRDFIFHAAGEPGKVIIAGSNNTNFARRNDLASINHYDIESSGWYTLEWNFRDFGDGSLAVDLNLRNDAGTLLWTETRNTTADNISTVVGGNRYMWFNFVSANKLAIDNTSLIRKLPVISSPASGTAFVKGETIVTAIAEDACGHSVSNSFKVTVIDSEAPVITTCAPAQSAIVTNGCSVAMPDFTTTAQATDNCTGEITWEQSPTAETMVDFAVSPYTVILTAKDEAGNISDECTTTFTVEKASISGTLTYHQLYPALADVALNNVGLTLFAMPSHSQVGDPVSTGTDGSYSFGNLCAGDYSIEVTSNGKGVGGINSTDASAANAWGAFSGETIEYVQFLAGDVKDNDLFINAPDAQRIQKFFVFGTAFDRDPWSYWKKGVTISNNYGSKPANFNVAVSGANIENFDLYGMCTGDFNGSFVPDPTKAATWTVELNNSSIVSTHANQEFELPVFASSSMEVGAISLILKIPSDLVKVQDVLVKGSNVATDWVVNGDELRIGWYSSSPVTVAENGSLFTLKLKSTAAFTVDRTIVVSLKFDPLNELADGNSNVIQNASLLVAEVNNGVTGIRNPIENNDLSLINYPNPFKGYTMLEYNLPIAGKVTIQVYNSLGQLVKSVVNANQNAGNYSIRMESNDLMPGIYIAKLRLTNLNTEMIGNVKLSVLK